MNFKNWLYNLILLSCLTLPSIQSMEVKEIQPTNTDKLWIDALNEIDPLAAGHILKLVVSNPSYKFLLTLKQSEVENHFLNHPELLPMTFILFNVSNQL